MKKIFFCTILLISALDFINGYGQSFQGIGPILSGYDSRIYAVSKDGSVLTGFCNKKVFYWSLEGGAVFFGNLYGENNITVPLGISPNASTIVGFGSTYTQYEQEAFRWTEAEGTIGLGDLSGGNYYSEAWDVSENGSVVVGSSETDNGLQAFRWTSDSGMVGMGYLPGGTLSSDAYGISDDGTVIVGSSYHAYREAFRWTAAQGMVGMGKPPEAYGSIAYDISGNGEIIAGLCYFPDSLNLVRWNKQGNIENLGTLPNYGYYYGRDVSISDDGETIVGYYMDATAQYRSFIWRKAYGVLDLKTAFENIYGLDVTNWTLHTATGISGDGSIIVGWGINPQDEEEGWIANIRSENILTVNNCEDSGPGSLRDAISNANSNPGSDTVRFQIPEGIPGHDATIGVWIIAPRSALPTITDTLYIDGLSQKEYIGEDTNPLGPEIWLNGELADQYTQGLRSIAGGTIIVGLTISNFQNGGIGMFGVDGGRISGCYVGVDYSGSVAAANNWGIFLSNNSRNVVIAPIDTFKNVISGNSYNGIIVKDTSSHIIIQGNIIGLDRTGLHPVGNVNSAGVDIESQCDSIEVCENWIGGNNHGIIVAGSQYITIQNNLIGLNKIDNEILELGNTGNGIMLFLGAHNNVITENFIRFNGSYGVSVEGTNTIRNKVSHNYISGNGLSGIYNGSGGNLELAPPVITSTSNSSITGTAIPNVTVEIYTDPEDEGLLFQDETNSDASGNFNWSGTITGKFTNVTAIAIDDSSNTSAFSQVAVVTNVEQLEDSNIPETFSLSQNFPNPFNPETEIEYTIPTRTNGSIVVYNAQGRTIRILENGTLESGTHSIIWNSRDEHDSPVSSGVYFIVLKAGEWIQSRKALLIR